MANPSFKFTEASMRDFDATLKRYLKVSGMKLADALNEKAYFILNGSPSTQGAIRLTHKADAERIRKELGGNKVIVGYKLRNATKKEHAAKVDAMREAVYNRD